MSNDCFDIKRFIEEVRNRPCLWDSTSNDYSDRNLRLECWESLADIFKDEEELTNNEKDKLVDALQKRWKALRGCFTRELQRRKSLRSGVGTMPRLTEYMHYKQLQFLEKVVTHKPAMPLAIAADSETESHLYRPGTKRKRIIQPKPTTIPHRLNEAVKQSNDSTEKCECSNQDEDRLFMLSLVNTLKRVPTGKKMATKIKIMSVLDDATSIALTEHGISSTEPDVIKIEYSPEQ